MSEPSSSQNKIIELSELAGGLAHEIRNPLSTLKVNLQLLAEDLGDHPGPDQIDPDFKRRALQRIQTLRNEVDRLQNLMTNFLRLVSKNEAQTRLTDLNQIIQQVADFIAPQIKQQHIQLRVFVHPAPLVCNVDSDLMKQALLNLVLNAQQAMPSGGELMISTRLDGPMASIDITDTGVGIDLDIQDRIFLPFFSTKKEGSGLGLSLTRRIVQEHGGTIAAQSEPNKGSRFILNIPLANLTST